MTGIIGAMRLEIEKIEEKLVGTTHDRISGIEFVSGTLEGEKVVAAVCGIGKCFAAMCAQTMILKYKPDRIINIGVAGTLSDKLGIGDIAVASSVVQYDMDTSPLGDPVGMLSGINIINIPCCESLADDISECAAKQSIKNKIGTIASGDSFISDRSKKEWIAKTFTAIACEMEGGAIAQVCYVNRVDCAVIRSISDNADGDSGDFLKFASMAAEHSCSTLCALLKSFN